MPVETRAQLARKYLAVVQAIPHGPALGLGAESLVAVEPAADGVGANSWEQGTSWWVDEGEMAPAVVNDGRQRFSGKKISARSTENVLIVVLWYIANVKSGI